MVAGNRLDILWWQGTDWTYYSGREQTGHTIVVGKMLPQVDLITDWTYYCGRENAATSRSHNRLDIL